MIKKFLITIFFLSVILTSSKSLAETKEDCSKYSTKTWAGLTAKIRCKKGLPPNEKSVLNPIDWKKKKFKPTYIEGKPCHEYNTKTFTGLMAKLKCDKNK